MSFRKDFIWGAATSAYQIEGAPRVEGKGLSTWDVFSHQPGRIADNFSGDVACDHYHRFREDIALMKAIGISAYRFSVSWTRILPEGTGQINPAGLRFYDQLIDALLEAGITPYLTLFHWDLPLALERRGGWMNPDCVEWFGDYAALISAHYADRVKDFFTINEPQCAVGLGYLRGEHAPGLRRSLSDTLLMAHHVMMAHGRGVQRLREQAKGPIRVGYSPTCGATWPLTESEEDIAAAREQYFAIPEDDNWTWNVPWWSDPVLLGEYPAEGLERFAPWMPRVTQADMKLISEPVDYYGQNLYNGCCVRMGEDRTPQVVPPGPGAPHTASNWPMTPQVMRWAPRFLYERYHKPIFITENGVSGTDWPAMDGHIHDGARIDFIRRYLAALSQAADDGADIRGYFYWSLLDNYEWNEGYNQRYGLIYVDFETQERILKDSALWYRDMITKGSHG